MSGAATCDARVLCRLDEIEDGEGKGFSLGEGGEALDIFVVRDGDRVFGYVNSCPHLGTPLDWTPDQFISADGGHIICTTHGALFRIEDGFCLAGPCEGDGLAPISVGVDAHGQVILAAGPKA